MFLQLLAKKETQILIEKTLLATLNGERACQLFHQQDLTKHVLGNFQWEQK